MHGTTEEIRELQVLLQRISNWYMEIEDLRAEDRAKWTDFNKQLEDMERERSQKAANQKKKILKKDRMDKLGNGCSTPAISPPPAKTPVGPQLHPLPKQNSKMANEAGKKLKNEQKSK